MVPKCLTGLKIAILLGFLANSAFSQCVNGVCQMRTPVRSAAAAIINAQPIRSTIQAARPANWKVFQNQSAGCSSVQNSCSGQSVTSYSVAPTACYNVVESWQGSQVAQPIAKVSEITTTSIASAESVQPMGVIGDRIKARRAIIESARMALRKDDISLAQFLLISGATRNPATLDKLMIAIHESAIEDGVASIQAIDWDGLIGFIERLLPIIIQLIGLFG